ncbi:MAG: aspartate aminotransferase family protein, partial [Anderseniella sp.]
VVQSIVADCFATDAVIIGATNRSLGGLNNTLCFSPALICTKSDLDEVIASVDRAMTKVEAA